MIDKIRYYEYNNNKTVYKQYFHLSTPVKVLEESVSVVILSLNFIYTVSVSRGQAHTIPSHPIKITLMINGVLHNVGYVTKMCP